MTPFSARLTFLGLMVLAGSIAANALYMQPPADTKPALAERSKAGDRVGAIISREEKSAAGKGPLIRPPQHERRTGAADAQPRAQPERIRRQRADPPPRARTPPRNRTAHPAPRRELVRAIQRELWHRDYQIDRRDGQLDLATRLAILRYQYNSSLNLTGRPSEALLEQILFGPFRGAHAEDPVARFEADRELVARVQRMLSRLGFANLKGTGLLGTETRSALRDFAQFRDLRPTGRLTPRLLLELADVTDEPLVQGGLRESEAINRF